MELDPQESPGNIKRKEVQLDPQESPGEIQSREVELGSHREVDSPLLQLFLNSCFSDTVFAALLRTAVETAVSEVHKWLRTGGVPTSLTVLQFWRCLTVSSVFAGRSERTSYSLPPIPLSRSLISLKASVDLKLKVKKKSVSSSGRGGHLFCSHHSLPYWLLLETITVTQWLY